MSAEIDISLIEAAKRIAPVVRRHRDEAERERRFSRPAHNALVEESYRHQILSS